MGRRNATNISTAPAVSAGAAVFVQISGSKTIKIIVSYKSGAPKRLQMLFSMRLVQKRVILFDFDTAGATDEIREIFFQNFEKSVLRSFWRRAHPWNRIRMAIFH